MAKAKSSTKSLSEIEAEIKKLHGATAMFTADDDIPVELPFISTGIIDLDEILGGGLAKGTITDLYGPENSGKTGIALRFLAEAQKEGVAVFIDLENAYNPNMARLNGVDISKLRVVTGIETAEDILKLIEDLTMSGEVSGIVVDSFAGLVPAAEMAGDIGDSHVGLIGRLASQALRILTTRMAREHSETIIIFVNQLRANIGGYGNAPSSTVTGGRAVKFYSRNRIEVKRIENLKQGEDVIGHKIKVKTDKSRLSAPFQTATFDVYYGVGISNESSIIDRAVEAGLIVKKGAWFADAGTGESLGQGRIKVIEHLRNDPAYYEELKSKLIVTDS